MPPSINKLNFYRMAQKNPALALMRVLEELKKISTDSIIKEAVPTMEKIMESKLSEVMGGVPQKVDQQLQARAERLKNIEKAHIDAVIKKVLPQIPPPEKGEKGEPGSSPKAGKDYLTPEQTKKVVERCVVDYMIENQKTEKKEGVTEEEISIIAGKVKQTLALPDVQQILKQTIGPDYIKKKLLELSIEKPWFPAEHIKGLKEIQQLTVKEKQTLQKAGRVLRGGGDIVFMEDISDQCDGSTKSFTVPVHRKVLILVSTDTPRVYRPTVDFTTSGTNLTLTSEVSAPLLGASLLFMYVV